MSKKDQDKAIVAAAVGIIAAIAANSMQKGGNAGAAQGSGSAKSAAIQGQGGKTALMVAAERGDLAAVESQLAAGADVNAITRQTRQGEYEEVLDKKENKYAIYYATDGFVHSREEDETLGRYTALMFAAKGGHMDVVRRLVEAGADANTGGGVYCGAEPTIDACELVPKALGWATLAGHAGMVEYLLQHGAKAKEGLLGAAAADGNTEIVKLLLRHKAPAGPGLKLAAAHGQTEAVRLLLDAGAKINESHPDICGKTALMYAAEGGHTETVRLLLARGANKNLKSAEDDMGMCTHSEATALGMAEFNGHTQTANVLKAAKSTKSSKSKKR